MRVSTGRAEVAERTARVAEMTRAGMSTREIAEQLGICTKAVTAARGRVGLKRPAPSPLTAEEVAFAKRLLDDGCPYAEVARTLGRTHHAIRDRLPGYGWPHGHGAELRRMFERLEAIDA